MARNQTSAGCCGTRRELSHQDARSVSGVTLLELLVCLIIISALAAILLPAMLGARKNALRAQCANHMFQIGIALHNYHDAHRTFPPGYVSQVGATGQDLGPGWSWASMLLPFAEQSNTYQRIHFDEPADITSNWTMARQRIELFMCPADSAACSYVASFGQGDMWRNPDQGDGVFFRNSRVRLRDIDDGAMTILVGERSSILGGAEWAAVSPAAALRSKASGMTSAASNRTAVLGHTGTPDGMDPVHSPNWPAACGAGFGSMHADGANFLLADGSVRFLSSSIDGSVFAGLASRAGGELVNPTDF